MSFCFDPETHVYTMDGNRVPSVTQVLERCGIIDTRWYKESGCQRGKDVHQALHFLDEGDELNWDELAEELIPYIQAYQKFKRDTGFKPDLIECPVFNPVYCYAGCLDRTGTMNGQRVLIDIKSGGYEDWTALQTAAYANCLNEDVIRYGLQLTNKGTYKLHPCKDPQDINVFINALNIEHWKHNHSKKGGAYVART